MERGYHRSVRVLGVAVCLLGLAMAVTTLARGGGPFALGVLLGVAFMAAGAGRAYLATRAGAPRGGG